MIIYTKNLETPLGTMICGVNDKGLFLLDFPVRSGGIDKILQRICKVHGAEYAAGEHDLFTVVQQQLQAYFEGGLKAFDLPLQLSGTAFQQKVWQALLEIPYGIKRSYKQQAELLGDVKAIRAVGKANGDNCLAVIVPCHRVLATGGALRGYAGGLHNKQWLLAHEAQHAGQGQQQAMF